MLLRLIVYFTFLFSFLSLQAQPLIHLDKIESGFLGKKVSVLEDPNRAFKIDDVLKLKDKFLPSDEEVISKRTGASAFWFLMKIKNTTDHQFYLEIANPKISELEIYTVDNDKVLFHYQTGDNRPFIDRIINTSNFIYPLNIPKDKSISIYIHYTDAKGLLLPLTIKSTANIITSAVNRNLANGIYYGIMFFAILYNLFLFIMIKDRSYLYYAVFISSFLLLQSEINGHTFQYLWPNCFWFNHQAVYFFSALTGFSAILFTRRFLQTKTRTPKLHICGYILQVIAVISIILSFIKNPPVELIIINQGISSIYGFLFSPFMLATAMIVTFQGYPPARLFLVAWIIFLIGIVVFILEANNVIPSNFLTINTLQIGSAMETVLISIALGEKFNLLKKEKEETQRILNKELEKSNQDLLRINTDLDNFVYTASHDLKAPIVNIEGLINILKSNPGASEEETNNIVQMISVSIDKFKNTIEDLSKISKIQKNQEIDIEVNDASKAVEEIQFLLKTQIENAGAKIETDFTEISHIKFSRKNFRSILYNLIINAINYRSHERTPKILIKTQKSNDHIILSINDNGLGISDEYHLKIFQLFKRAHNHVEGTGIGLFIVKRIIENEGGKIELESKEGEGSTFKVFFKIDFHENANMKIVK